MTPTAVGLVLVEGHSADGEIMEQDAFDIPTRRGATAISTSEYVAGTMSRTRAMADGRRPHAIGVTWSDDSELEASLLVQSLTDAGFDNVVAIRSPKAGEALARGIGRAVGYHETAVCLLEPESIVVSMVDTYDGAVQTVGYHGPDTDGDLIGWLCGVFDINDWDPECLILVGPDAGLTGLATQLEHALKLPVFAPPEAELALARGAALASAQSPEFTFGDDNLSGTGHPERWRRWPLPYTAALTMLVVGVVALVVSVSLVAGLKLTSNSGSGAASSSSQQPAAKPVPPPVQVVVPPAAPPPVEVAPPPEAAPVPPPESDAAPPEEAAPIGPVEDASAAQPDEAPPGDMFAPSPEAAPPEAAPPAPVPPPPTTSGQKPPLLTRILQHIPGLHPDPQPPGAPPSP